MNTKAKQVVALVLTFALGGLNAFGESADDKPLTLALAKEVWNASYEYPLNKFEMVSKFMKRVDEEERVRGTNLNEIASIKAYLFDAVLQTKPATVDDYGNKIVGTVLVYGDFLRNILHWECTWNRECLMRVANSIASFKPLPEYDVEKAKQYAYKIDDFLQYGSAKPPRRVGLAKQWSGPISERVVKVSIFRKDYNRRVREMKDFVADSCYCVIFRRMSKRLDEASRQALWEEFALESGVNPKDWVGK